MLRRSENRPTHIWFFRTLGVWVAGCLGRTPLYEWGPPPYAVEAAQMEINSAATIAAQCTCASYTRSAVVSRWTLDRVSCHIPLDRGACTSVAVSHGMA